MNHNPVALLAKLALISAVLLFHAPSTAADAKPAPATADTEAAYAQSIEKRTADILAVLELKDVGKTEQVHNLLIHQYRALRDWHDTNDPKLKRATEEQAKTITTSRKALHDQFVSALSALLTPEQVEKVKDKMTYGAVKVTYDAYCEIIPQLTQAEKNHILALLKEAREEAMDGGSHQEKAAVFKRYKGKINNYLDRQGHDVKQAYKDWGAKQKAKVAAP